jgi:titin
VDFLTRLETGVSRLYRANPATGDATNVDIYGRIGGLIQTVDNKLGLTTGMSFVDGTLYGVDTNGYLFTISLETAQATIVKGLGIPNLQALANGPQNVAGGPSNTIGYFNDKLFALDGDGWLYAIDRDGNQLDVFENNTMSKAYFGPRDPVTREPLPGGTFTGFAFSPIDIPLWRGTNNRGGEAGHGVTPALDRTRDGLFDDDGKKSPEQIGHTSIYYGFDATSGFAPDRTTVVNHLYLNPAVTTWASHLASGIGTSVADLPVKGSGQVTVAGFTTINSRDVTVAQTGRLRAGMSVTGPGIQPNTLISEILGNVVRLSRVATVTTPPETTVDLTFTGEGIAIRTNSFSLADHDYTDKPTLYFNYRIESGAGSTKVQASIDGGGEWITIASNASGRSPIDTALNDLPAFPSVSSRIGGQPNQLVQELFQNTGWRQARIDLGIFAGAPDIQLRIIFNPITVAGNCEGIYLDDFVVGFAERGEMVTNAPANTAFFGIGTPVSATTPQQNLQGAYQLEIRRGKEYGGLSSSTSGAVQIAGDPDQWPYNVITTNDSLVRGTAHSGAGAAGVTPEQNLRGDDNNPRGQGQFIIEGNVITHADQFGIRIDAAARDAATGTSTSGVVKNTPVTNSSRLVPGVVVANNVIASTHREAGLLFSGDSQTNLPAPVPYGRIVNNTIYGGASVTLPGTFQAASAVVTVPSTAKLWAGMMVTGTGIPADTRIQSIDSATQVRLTRAATAAGTGVQLLFAFRTVGVQVTDNAAPTLLNNVFASLATGIEVDGTSTGTVVGFSAFYETAAGVTGSDARVIPSNPFVDAARGNFYPKAGSPIIDAAIDVLQDRPSYRAVTQPLGIPASPIIVPRTDLFGQLRSDDPTQASPTGLGSNVFKDLGAIDRVDFVQPSATLAVPLDGATGSIVDQDPDNNQVRLVKADARGIAKFELQLNDVGVGVDKTTVVKQAFAITRGGTTLTEGTDYVFRFLESTNRVVFEAAAIYPMGSYVISVVQAPVNGVPTNVITDLAGNPLLPNNGDGTTSFAIDLADVPTPPTGLVGLTGDQQVQLSWTAAVSDGSPLTRYEVQQAENASFTGATTTNVLPPAVSLTATPLVNGTPYWFRVRAVNAVGDSEWSNVTGPVVPLPIPTFALAQDTGASSSDGVTSNRTVNVSGVLGGASWEYSVDGGTIWSAGTGSSFQLPANATYAVGNVRIRQVVGESLSGSFSNATAITVDTNAPAAPTVALGTGVADTANLAEATQVSGVVRVTGELGSTITVTFTRGANIVTKTVTGTGVSQPIVLTTTDVQTTLGDGTITVSATQTDLAGNGSAPASTTSFLLATTPASAPTSVAGTPGNQQVALTWVVPTSDGGSAITDYVVQYRVNALGSQWTTFADGGSTALAATVTGLTNGTAYVFRVAAVTGAGDGAYSVESAPVTPRTVPGVPTGLTGVMGDSAVTLNWSAPSSNGGALITDYVVQYRVNALGSQWTTFADGTSAVSSATVTGLTNGTAYVFRVAAVNVAGAGGYSAESAAVTPLAPALAPTSLAGTAGNQQVALSWGVPASDGGSVITDYVIQYRVQGVGASWTTFADGTSSAVAATVTGLTNGTAYVFRVAAVTAVGVGAFSARSAAIVPVTAPAAPTAVAGVAGNSQVTLSWTAPASDGGVPIKDYQISYSSDGTNYTVFNDGLSAGTTATVTGLTNGTTYIFRVAAVNGSDLVGPAGESGSVRPFVLLAAPTALVAVGQNGRVSLSWVAPGPGVVDYRVEFRVSGVGAAWQTFADGTSTATQAVVTGLTNGTQYAFRVAAVSADGLGLYSGPVTATPVSVPVAAPTSVRGTRASSTITLQWNPPPVNPAAPTTRYVIQYRLNAAGSVWQTLAIQPTATSVVINGLTNRLGYFFRVAGANGAGVGPWSASSARI